MAETGILLAAGESRRMGFPKPLLMIEGRTFIEHIAGAMLAVVPHLIVVLGAHADRVRPAVPKDARIEVVVNRDFSRGQLSSLKVGLGAVAGDAAAVLVHLADHPMVKPATFSSLLQKYRAGVTPILIARHAGRRGHPVVFGREVFGELGAAPEDQGARAVVNRDPTRVAYLDVDDLGVSLDLDSLVDLRMAGLEPPPKA